MSSKLLAGISYNLLFEFFWIISISKKQIYKKKAILETMKTMNRGFPLILHWNRNWVGKILSIYIAKKHFKCKHLREIKLILKLFRYEANLNNTVL